MSLKSKIMFRTWRRLHFKNTNVTTVGPRNPVKDEYKNSWRKSALKKRKGVIFITTISINNPYSTQSNKHSQQFALHNYCLGSSYLYHCNMFLIHAFSIGTNIHIELSAANLYWDTDLSRNRNSLNQLLDIDGWPPCQFSPAASAGAVYSPVLGPPFGAISPVHE